MTEYQAGRYRIEILYEDNHLLVVRKPPNMAVQADASGDLDLQSALKGFASVEGGIFGKTSRYMDLSCIHVSQDMRHSGIGRRLFDEARRFARARGAQKLYISAHSAVESQAFYEAMGCVDAQEIQRAHAEKEPFDRQLECAL